MIAISKLASSVQPSATLAAVAKARQLRAQGHKVYDFSIGEPDFPTPAHICAAAERAMRAGHTHYTAVAGIAELRAAIARWYQRYHGFECKPEEVLVSNGAKHSIHTALAAVCNPGDEVIIPTPYWVSYSDLVSMTGAVPVLVHTTRESGFKMSPEQLRAAVTPRTRLLMLNSPSNPTGTVYSAAELRELLAVLKDTSVAVLSDEIYEQLTYGAAKATCVATLEPSMRDRIITISGASKSYAMTGWRMGWTVAPRAVIDAMNNVQGQETSCPSSVSQYALLEALDGPQDCVAQMRTEFEKRRDLVCAEMGKIPGLLFDVPEGAFYLFFDVRAYFGRVIGGFAVSDSMSFCKAALEGAFVNLVPGVAFGAEGFARMSYATAEDELRGGIDQLARFLNA